MSMDSNQKNGSKSNVERIEKLTALQEGMYFYHEINPNDGGYHEQSTYHIKGKFQAEYAQTAMNLLAQAHDALRSSFLTLKNGEIVQVILKERKLECSCEKTGKSLDALRREDIQRGFNFQKDPLLRLKIVEAGEEEYYLIWSYHHIIMDGWCMSIIMGDFLRFYNALEHGTSEAALQEEIRNRLATQPGYGDYLRLNTSRDKEEALRYWKDVLEGYENAAGIQPVSSVPQETEASVAKEEITLPTELTALLRKRATDAQVTANTILETAWGLVLQRYNHTRDVVFGKVVSGRDVDLPGVEKIVGLFINTIPCRIETEEGESIEKLLQKVQSNDNKAGEYDYAPLAEVQAQSLIGRNLIQTLFVFENFYFDESAVEGGMEGAEIELLKSRSQTNYALTLSASMGRQLLLQFKYDPKKYSAEEIKAVLTHYMLALEEIAKDPTRPAEEIAMCTEAERRQILEVFNDTAVEYPKEKTVIDLFEEQVRKTPEKTAVVFEDKQITYAELNEKANLLARKLRMLGVQTGSYVAMLTERSLEMVIGIYGVLKAGGAYVPLDPTYPAERIRYMLKDCGARAVLTYHARVKTNITVLDLAGSEVWTGSSADLEHLAKPSDLAYCIYTSGTTGQPKGVLVKHQNVVNYTMQSEKSIMAYAFAEKLDRIVSVTNITFDIFATEAILPLCNGMTVYVANREEQVDLQRFEALVRNNAIEIMQTTPSRIKALLAQNADTEAFSGMKYIMLGGETVGSDIVRQLKTRTRAEIVNVYGPTETTIFSTCYTIKDDMQTIPIGKPISNTKVYICNGTKLCGIGIPGELCIAGDGVARGYLRRQELTAEKFIDDPFGEGKLYRTGDLARWLPDGNLDYLGRIDEQVKIRGFRIELGEIESCIRSIWSVKDCAVIARADAHGEKAIYAYVVSEEGIGVTGIRDRLAQLLPEYMIPAYITEIEKIPMTRNGKLDKRALPEIESKSEREFIAPRNAEEEAICAAFSEVLGVEKVGVKDNFFELGGHSLKAVWLVKQIETRTGHKITLNDILTSPTVEMLAEIITGGAEREALKKENTYETISQLTVGENEPAIICFPFAGGFDSAYWKLSEELRKQMPKATVYSLKYANWVDMDFETALKEVSEIIEGAHSVILYSHCGGSGMLLRICHNLENADKIKYLIIGASIPKKRKNVIEKIYQDKPATDEDLRQSLAHAGFMWEEIPKELEQDVLDQFRKDAESCFKDLDDLYGIPLKSLPCKVVVGDADPDIPELDEVEIRWNHYFEKPINLVVLHGANHYFHKKRAVELATIIRRCYE